MWSSQESYNESGVKPKRKNHHSNLRALSEPSASSAFMFHDRSLPDHPFPTCSTPEQNPRPAIQKMFLFFSNVHQKSVNKGQIIPVFTFFCDDK
jgi:hypothetical protein